MLNVSRKIFAIALLTCALSFTSKAQATVLTFDLTPETINGFWNVYINVAGVMSPPAPPPGQPASNFPGVPFTALGGTFAFDTTNGWGTLAAKMKYDVDGSDWLWTGIFSDTSFINAAGGFDPNIPSVNYDLYFDYLVNHNNGYVGSDPFANATAITFDNLDLTLEAQGPTTYQGLTNFAGGSMGHMAYIHYLGSPSADVDNFQLSYWCYTDYDNDNVPGGYDGGQGDTFAWGPNTGAGSGAVGAVGSTVDGGAEASPDRDKDVNEALACDHFWTMQGNVPDSTVPEPATMALMGMGLAGFGLRKRTKK